MQTFYADCLNNFQELHDDVAKTIEGLPLEALDWSPRIGVNSITVLIVHLTGSEKFLFGEVIGGQDVHRDRDAEFLAKGIASDALIQPLNDSLGFIGARANVKGFLCEYMTAGRVVVLGDPGPWICAGMTGGVLYLRLQPHLNFDQAALQRRLAKGAKVLIQEVGEKDLTNLRDLLTIYADELKHNHQAEESQKVLNLLVDWKNTFVRVVPLGKQEEQRFATE